MSYWHRRIWAAELSGGPLERGLFRLLAPAEWAYRLAVRARAWAYDRGILRSRPGPIPTLAVGNLTVGGTGKTPVAAWFARALAARGHRPAVVMRGYGGDEVDVHRTLNPDVPVVATAQRVLGVRRAHERGADVAVLDDAFQHRALRADAYVVLLSADDPSFARHLLPRGPWREPLGSLARASLAIMVRKIASLEQSEELEGEIARRFPQLPLARAHLHLAGLQRYDAGRLGTAVDPMGLRCRLAVAGVARPESVWQQLADLGVIVSERRALGDHHRFTRSELREISGEARRGPVVATLKDAVKLGPAMTEDAELYVPVQRLTWEAGEGEVETLIRRFDRPPARPSEP